MTESDLEAVWLTELGHDLRARRDAEYFYTAAAVALFGGVAWGVAGQHHGRAFYIWTIVGVFAVAAAVAYKIYADHKNYDTIWSSRRELFKRLSKRPGADEIFSIIKDKKPGKGFAFSILVLLLSALLPVFSCISGLFSN